MEFSPSFTDWMNNFNDNILAGEKLSSWDKAERDDFVSAVLDKMAKQCGGTGYFWRWEEKTLVLEGWVEALEEFSAIEIIRCVYLALEGQYKHGEHNTPVIPKTALEFKCFVKNQNYRRQEILPKKYAEIIPDETGENYKKFKKQMSMLTKKVSLNGRI